MQSSKLFKNNKINNENVERKKNSLFNLKPQNNRTEGVLSSSKNISILPLSTLKNFQNAIVSTGKDLDFNYNSIRSNFHTNSKFSNATNMTHNLSDYLNVNSGSPYNDIEFSKVLNLFDMYSERSFSSINIKLINYLEEPDYTLSKKSSLDEISLNHNNKHNNKSKFLSSNLNSRRDSLYSISQINTINITSKLASNFSIEDYSIGNFDGSNLVFTTPRNISFATPKATPRTVNPVNKNSNSNLKKGVSFSKFRNSQNSFISDNIKISDSVITENSCEFQIKN